jgi:hypothetical protein
MTTENNILLAEFMGAEIEGLNYKFIAYDNIKVCMHPNRLNYHTDWNWLMQVVEKVESLEKPITNSPNLVGKFETYEIHIQHRHVRIYAHGEVTKEVVDLRSSESNNKIEAVYNACVSFVKWYNNQK